MKGQLNTVYAFIVLAVMILLVIIFANMMFGKMAVINETEFGNNTNATASINESFGILGVGMDLSSLGIYVGLFFVALFAILGFLGKGKKGGFKR